MTTSWRSILRTATTLPGLALAGLTSAGLLAGCASTPPPVVPAAPAIQPIAQGGESEGAFKIGKPYQVNGKWYYPSEDYGYVQEGIASWYGQDFQGKRTANGELYDMNAVTAAHPTLPLPSIVRVTNLDNGRVLDVRVNDRGPFHSSRIIDLSRRAAQLLGFYDVGTARVRVEINAQASLDLKNLALKEHPPEMPLVIAAPRATITETSLTPVVASAGDIAATPPAAPDTSLKPAAPAQSASGTTAKKPAPAAKKAPPQPETRIARADPGPEIPGLYVQAGAFSDPANARHMEEQLRTLGNVVIEPVTVNNAQLYRVRLGPIADPEAANSMLGRVKGFGYDDAKIVRE